MLYLLKKEDQLNNQLFQGNFLVNKPVGRGYSTEVAPYSNLFYWSHAVATGDCQFGLHPHKGFEIMTFILEGEITHYDTASNIWTPLHTGDFQIIRSGSGLQHAEKISKGTRSFQIWFDPNFNEAIKQAPAYKDFPASLFQPVNKDGTETINYVGNNSHNFAQTEDLFIQKLSAADATTTSLEIGENKAATVYQLSGQSTIQTIVLDENDAVRIFDTPSVTISFSANSKVFVITTPAIPSYKTIFNE